MLKISCIIILFIVTYISCNSKNEVKTKTTEKHKIRADSVNMEFLGRVVYDTAIYHNNLPTANIEYLLNEIYPIHLRVGLKKAFSVDKFDKPIPIKEVTWEFDEKDFITVWYTPKESVWKPIDIYKYSKTAQF